MADYEYEEENLDDFMINAANVLSEDNNPEKGSIIESLKQHLSSIFHIQSEMENFFRTLNGVIFTTKDSSKNTGQMIDNKEPFVLYPLIFSFNPKTTSYFIDYYFRSLQQSICEENRADFTFLSEVFADVITAFFSDDKNNQNLIKKSFTLDQNKKKALYDKILNFCNGIISTNKKLDQSFGCLLLTELIEKCPLVKEDKNLDSLFKIISDYLDDRWFECKLDLLNCTISLIFAAEAKFKPYANVCLFRVLDYLTDMDWMKRKLAVNIVYTLVFYCKDEIMAVKENIIEFLNMLKEDSIPEVREVCLHTLKFLDEGEEGQEEFEEPEINFPNERDKPRNVFDRYSYKKSQKNAKSNRPKRNDDLKIKLPKKKDTLNKMENDNMPKKKNYNINSANKSKSNTNRNNNLYSEKQKPKSKQNTQKETPQKDTYDYEKDVEAINSSINNIADQLQKIQDDQAEFRQMLNNLKQTAGNNYLNLNERIRTLEKNTQYNDRNPYNQFRDNYRDPKSNKGKKRKPNVGLSTSDEKAKIEDLKTLFNSGKYNEALLETYQNDRYLLKLVPLMERRIIPKIEIALLEDAITRLNKRIPILYLEGNREKINEVLLFYIQLMKSKVELKLVMKLGIKDALKFLRGKGDNILTEEHNSNIERILNSLKA